MRIYQVDTLGKEVHEPGSTTSTETGGKGMTREEAIKRLNNIKARCIRLKCSSPANAEQYVAEEEEVELAIKSMRPCGKWIRKRDIAPHVECSECGYSIYACPLPGEKEHYYKFCPGCGAIMKEEVQE